jgi:hypothetical protein
VIQTYDNVKFGDSRPLTDLLDQLSNERKHDEIRTYSGLKLDDECKLVDGGATFTKRGFASLCRLTSMPTQMVGWLSQNDYKPELARFINSELVGLEFDDEQNNRPKKRIFTRFRGSHCRALFSDRYAAVDVNVLVAMVADALTAQEREQARVHRFSYDGDQFFGTLLIGPESLVEVGNERYVRGISLVSSEDGSLRISLEPFIGRLACSNGLIVCTPAGQAVSKRHVGKVDLSKLAADIRVTVVSSFAQSDRALVQLEAGRKVELANAERIIIQLGRDHRLTTEQIKGWLRGHDVTLSEPTVGEVSAFSIINGLTKSAQESEIAEERTQLESLAGNLVAPRFDALFEQIEAEWRRVETRASMLSDEVVASYLG